MIEMTKFKADMIKWTTLEGQKLFWSLEIFEMLSFFFLMPQAQRLPFLTYMSTCLMNYPRCCIILQKDGKKHSEKKLILTAGYPNEGSAHGFGLEITPATGKTFLTKVIEEGNIVIIPDSQNDRQVAYMKDLILHHGIRKQIFVPLFLKRLETGFKVDPFGVLVFDSTKENQTAFENTIVLAKKSAMVAVALIINEERRQKMDYELARISCANVFREHAEGFKDEFRNTPTTLAAFAKKIKTELEKLKTELPTNKQIERALAYATNIIEISSRFEKKSEEFLLAISLKLSDFDIQEHDLQKFIRSVVDKFVKEKNSEQQEICVNLDFSRLAKNKKARFDWKKMADCLQAILDNAARYEAGTIWFKVFIKHREANKPIIVITISNDGLPMSQGTAEHLLKYFSSTDRQTGSGGLAIANAIVQAHGGEIKLKIQSKTQFVIQLPII